MKAQILILAKELMKIRVVKDKYGNTNFYKVPSFGTVKNGSCKVCFWFLRHKYISFGRGWAFAYY